MPSVGRPGDGRRRVALLVAAILILLCGCTNAASGPKLANESPYWCEIVPKSALTEVQGIDESTLRALREQVGRALFNTDSYGCSVEAGSDPRWGFGLEVLRGSKIDERLKKISTRFEYDRVLELPSSMGDGGASLTTGWVRWGCGGDEVLIYIVLQSGVEARGEPEPYVVATLRVAQERYAQLANCSVEPAPEEAS